MQLSKPAGVAVLLLGALSAGLVFAAYGDVSYSYRSDGMILCNGEVFFPVGVYFIPLPDQRTAEELLNEVEAEGRAFLFDEFAAIGGNFVAAPCFHYYRANVYNSENAWWNDFWPQDLTDMRDPMPEPSDIELDLAAAAAVSIKLTAEPALTYKWDYYAPRYYLNQIYARGQIICEGMDNIITTERETDERAAYFNDVVENVVASCGETAFLGWSGAQEPAWIPWRRRDYVVVPNGVYLGDVYRQLRDLESQADANHPVFIEECKAAIVSDLYRWYHGYCDILAYNIRTFPAPNWGYNYMNNRWESIHGDAADMHNWSVDGAKPVLCCVDAVWDSEYDKFPTHHQLRFSTYDAIIHRVNGLLWGMYHYVYPVGKPPETLIPDAAVETRLKPVITEVGAGIMNEVLKAPFDDTMIEAIARKDGLVVERTAFIGGDLAPKTHICSGRYLMEGCVKYYDGFVYLIAACREGRAGLPPHEPVNNYEVTFKPYYSGSWNVEYVEVVNEGRERTIVNGTFTDNFVGEDVHIYKFPKPTCFAAAP